MVQACVLPIIKDLASLSSGSHLTTVREDVCFALWGISTNADSLATAIVVVLNCPLPLIQQSYILLTVSMKLWLSNSVA